MKVNKCCCMSLQSATTVIGLWGAGLLGQLNMLYWFQLGRISIGFFSLIEIYVLIFIAISISLAYGSIQKQRKWIAPYVYIGFFYIIINIILAVLYASSAFVSYPNGLLNGLSIILLLFQSYCWFVVYRFYQELLPKPRDQAAGEIHGNTSAAID